ncbi:tetratricopeptide repeat-containing glycosyltransferase family protein [Asaia krungthepensis]|uniref:O-linked N-acetylglucosamine transferase n=1 Tax=Asaia krungthepensis NRIC 0535 TaxID=1307925 RepID=A0ABQ0Q5A7_9PROT|nr:tetratricopeptide repeat-containing glycosyltransferase family protein [Asaia krungthepensis]GBQ92033.1 O-linked N-acetylglucosamine transferase [Asaia krungthepensis NRIC 0535]
MSSDAPPPLKALLTAFHQNASQACLDLARQCDTGNAAFHPLQSLLPHAEAHDRRKDLLLITDMALAAQPEDCRLLELSGALRMQLGDIDEAIEQLRLALARRPNHMPALSTFACALTQGGHFDEALVVLEKIRAHDPSDPSALSNIAYLHSATGHLHESLNLYRQAIHAKPDHPQMRLNYSIALLKAGYFQQGWTEHEWRFQLPGHTTLPMARLLPNITADLDLRGKHVLITQEEGYGDSFMYLRFIPLLAERGAIIRLWGADVMADLCARVNGVDTVQVGGDIPPYDYHCPFISLPRAFAATATPFGVLPPYIAADPVKSAVIASRVAQDHNLRVGLVWAGAPRRDQTEAYMLDQRRSMPLDCLTPLAELTGVTFYSLQKGEAASQIATSPLPIIDLMPEMDTMDDTAALIDNLDIVVSVDTSMVHLAGAMGKRVLLMDRVNPCWRWMTGREDSPWYPSLQILRQTTAWDWRGVVSEVRDRLADAARHKHI